MVAFSRIQAAAQAPDNTTTTETFLGARPLADASETLEKKYR
jgi:hypothetical protein